MLWNISWITNPPGCIWCMMYTFICFLLNDQLTNTGHNLSSFLLNVTGWLEPDTFWSQYHHLNATGPYGHVSFVLRETYPLSLSSSSTARLSIPRMWDRNLRRKLDPFPHSVLLVPFCLGSSLLFSVISSMCTLFCFLFFFSIDHNEKSELDMPLQHMKH